MEMLRKDRMLNQGETIDILTDQNMGFFQQWEKIMHLMAFH